MKNNVAIVKTYPSRVEAEIGRGKLEASGIKAIIEADDLGGIGGYLLNATGFVRLMVLKEEYADAKKILDL